MDDYTHFFGLYDIKHGDKDVRFSVLNLVNRRHPLQFPVTLKKTFNPDEAIEVIEEKSGILNLKKLNLEHLGCLKDQIMYLVHDMLIWYKKRVKVIIPSSYYDVEEMERQGFIPFLSGADYLDIIITIRFYEKQHNQFRKKEEREVLRYNRLYCEFAFGRDQEEQALNREEFYTRGCIESHLAYELRKVWPDDGFLTNYASFCITYKLKRVDEPDPLFTRPDFRNIKC